MKFVLKVLKSNLKRKYPDNFIATQRCHIFLESVSSRVPPIELEEAVLIIDILLGFFESGSAFFSFDAYKNFPHHCVPIIFINI
jgi:hypothetical protein